MEGFHKAASFDDITPTRPKRVSMLECELVLYKVQEQIYAVENLCPHQHFALFHQGVLEGFTLTCPMHGWSFDIRTGKVVTGSGRIRIFEVRIEGKEVYVRNLENQNPVHRF